MYRVNKGGGKWPCRLVREGIQMTLPAAAHQSLENFTKVSALPLAASVQDEESSSRPSSEQTRGLHSLSRVLQVCFRSQWRRLLPFLP